MPPSAVVATDTSVRPTANAAGGQRTSSNDSDSFYYDPERNPTSFIATEYYWRDHYIWLEEQGYLLRPRYHPDWKPSWIGTDKKWYKCEDRLVIPGRARVLDATRISDDMPVVLKQYPRTVHPHEAEIGQLLSSEPLASDLANHCVPILDVLRDPQDDDIQLLVMPMLRRCYDPPFSTVGEVVDFFGQAFEGLQFMHVHNIAHRDAMILNLMMDPAPMYPELYHFASDWSNREYTGPAKHYTRTERPPRYLWTDFGLSRRYDSEAGPRLELPILGGDRSVPEHQGASGYVPCDPMPTDVYYIGNLIREYFLRKYTNLGFMRLSVDDMVRDNPTERPTMDEVVVRFATIRRKLHW